MGGDGVAADDKAALAAADSVLRAGNPRAAREAYRDIEARGGALTGTPALAVRVGQCYMALGEVRRAASISASLLRRDANDVDALLLQAEAQFQAITEHIDCEAWDAAAEGPLRATRHALSLDPENAAAAELRRRLRAQVALVRETRSAAQEGEWSRVEALLSEFLGNSPSSSRASYCTTSCAGSAAPSGSGRFAARCFAERARARLRLGDSHGSVEDCLSALRLDDRLAVAFLVQAQALQNQERWDDAVEVLEALREWCQDEDSFWKLEWAKFEVRRVRRPDYYAILGLDRACTGAEVKKRYLKLSAECHPDKVAWEADAVERLKADERFKLIGEAFEFIGNPKKRELYDRGYDAMGIREVLAVQKRMAGQAPCSKCGEDELGKIGVDGRWICLHCSDGIVHTAFVTPCVSVVDGAPPACGRSGERAESAEVVDWSAAELLGVGAFPWLTRQLPDVYEVVD